MWRIANFPRISNSPHTRPFWLLLSLKREFFPAALSQKMRTTKKIGELGILDREAAQSLRTQDSIVPLAKDARNGVSTCGDAVFS